MYFQMENGNTLWPLHQYLKWLYPKCQFSVAYSPLTEKFYSTERKYMLKDVTWKWNERLESITYSFSSNSLQLYWNHGGQPNVMLSGNLQSNDLKISPFLLCIALWNFPKKIYWNFGPSMHLFLLSFKLIHKREC